jgi:hypothetical protein
MEWSDSPPESRHLNRRSGRIPAEPYPPSRFRQYNSAQLRQAKLFAKSSGSRV